MLRLAVLLSAASAFAPEAWAAGYLAGCASTALAVALFRGTKR